MPMERNTFKHVYCTCTYCFVKCRSINGVRGFTRETLSAILVDIESREWRRQYNVTDSIPPEHPRASTTDDVQCFFSVLRDMVGKDFTHKEVSYMVMYTVPCKTPTIIMYNHIGDVWLEEGMPGADKKNGP